MATKLLRIEDLVPRLLKALYDFRMTTLNTNNFPTDVSSLTRYLGDCLDPTALKEIQNALDYLVGCGKVQEVITVEIDRVPIPGPHYRITGDGVGYVMNGFRTFYGSDYGQVS